MTPEEVSFALSPIDLGAAVAMVIGGFAFGALILWQAPVLRPGGASLWYVAFVFGLFGLIFFIARGVDLYLDRNPLWARSVGFVILWTVYTLFTVAGLALRRRTAE